MKAFFQEAGLGEKEARALSCMPASALYGRIASAMERHDTEGCIRLMSEGSSLTGPRFPLWALEANYGVLLSLYPDPGVRRATLSDIGIWTRRHESLHGGEVGLSNYRWISLHATGNIVRLGRLQFQTNARAEADLCDDEGHVLVSSGFPVLALHVPEGEPLAPEAVEESLRRARAWFPAEKYATCHSWLLDPALRSVLGPDSRILRFQELFHLYPVPNPGDPMIYERVFFFGARKSDVLSFPAETTLQKRVQETLRAGGSFRDWGGWLALR